MAVNLHLVTRIFLASICAGILLSCPTAITPEDITEHGDTGALPAGIPGEITSFELLAADNAGVLDRNYSAVIDHQAREIVLAFDDPEPFFDLRVVPRFVSDGESVMYLNAPIASGAARIKLTPSAQLVVVSADGTKTAYRVIARQPVFDVVLFTGWRIVVVIADLEGGYSISQQLGERIADAELEDVDLDGDLDIVAIERSGSGATKSLDIYLNDGNGHFNLGQRINDEGEGSLDLTLGDLDGNGYPDIIATQFWGVATRMWLNHGTAGFGDGKDIASSPTDPAASFGAPATIDIDADGDLDIVGIYGDFGSLLARFVNNGDATFAPAPPINMNDIDSSGNFRYFREYSRFLVANLDDDPFDDAVYTGGHVYAVSLLNDTNGSFVSGGTMPPGYVIYQVKPSLGDLDSDGDLDVLIGGHIASRYPMYNDGSGHFSFQDGTDIYAYPQTHQALADFDRDGLLDLYVTQRSDARPHQIWCGDGAGAFEPCIDTSVQVAMNTSDSSPIVLVGDLNGR